MTIEARIQSAFTRRLCSTPQGRAHVLATVAEAEASGESIVFERALARVDDPELQKLIEKHRADELRHERLFRDNQLASGSWVIARGLMGRGPASLPWRAAVALAARRPPPMTPFAVQPAV